jgi:hypothetical protein
MIEKTKLRIVRTLHLDAITKEYLYVGMRRRAKRIYPITPQTATGRPKKIDHGL